MAHQEAEALEQGAAPEWDSPLTANEVSDMHVVWTVPARQGIQSQKLIANHNIRLVLLPKNASEFFC
jgi:hypothetical protein